MTSGKGLRKLEGQGVSEGLEVYKVRKVLTRSGRFERFERFERFGRFGRIGFYLNHL